MDTTKTTTCIEWCAGYGGISLGLKRSIPSLRTIAYGEIEAFAIANLVSKMEAGLMDAAPLWTDIKTFPCEAFRGKVDILVAGYPCQPFSAAGKRQGENDPRHLWPYIRDSVRVIQPRLCFFENVEGHISLGLSSVISDLEELGYKVSWGIFSASEVGAPQQRKRVFILAYRSDSGLQGREWFWQAGAQGESSGYASECGNTMADCHSNQPSSKRGNIGEAGQGGGNLETHSYTAWPSRPGEPQHAWEPPRVVSGRQTLDDSEERCLRDDSENQRQTTGKSDTANDSSPCSGEAMAHTGSLGRRGRSDGDAGGLRGEIQAAGSCGGGAEAMGNAAFLRTQGQWPEQQAAGAMQSSCAETISDQGNWQTQPPMGRDADGPAGGLGYAELQVSCDNRTDELRLLGNGVVPATAERAFRTLLEELK